jgi:DNA (cytosine-5)-methyltransferase 1
MQRPERPATGNPLGLLVPSLVEMTHENRPASVETPLGTVTTQGNRFNLAAATLVQTGYGEREGQAARVPGLEKPLGTAVASGQKHALIAAFLAKHFGGVVGTPMEAPTSTVTSRDHQSLAAATLIRFNHDDNGIPIDAPAPATTASGNHVAEVRAFLTAFYGQDGNPGKGQNLRDPLRTITAKHRLGLVTIEGADYQIVDIGMRMLEPHELSRAQFGRFAEAFDLSAAKTKAKKVHLIGNSVCPEVAEAIVRANIPGRRAEEVA